MVVKWMWTPETWDGTWAIRCLGDLRVAASLAERADRADLFTEALYKMGTLMLVPALRSGVWS